MIFRQIFKYVMKRRHPDERKFIDHHIKKDKQIALRRQLLRVLSSLEKNPPVQRDIDTMWTKMNERIHTREKNATAFSLTEWLARIFSSFLHHFARPAVAYPLMVLTIACMSLYFFQNQSSTQVEEKINIQYKTVQVEHGKRITIRLSDGTEIIADAGSKVRFPTSFTNRRDVYLQGEAFFSVAHDPERPFYVHANHALVRVLGTKFNVRAWQENESVSVVVSRGKVSLQREDDLIRNIVTLTEGKASFLEANGLPSQPVDVDVNKFLTWMNNEMHFENAKLTEIFGQLERWFDIEIIVHTPALQEKRLSVHINNNNLAEILNVVSILTHTTVTKTGNRVEFTEK